MAWLAPITETCPVFHTPSDTHMTSDLELFTVVHGERFGINSSADVVQSLVFLTRVHALVHVRQNVVNQLQRMRQQLAFFHVRLWTNTIKSTGCVMMRVEPSCYFDSPLAPLIYGPRGSIQHLAHYCNIQIGLERIKIQDFNAIVSQKILERDTVSQDPTPI